jgi:hypothetical protein
MEDKLDESSNFKFLEDKTSKEDLLWMTQKGDVVTTFFMKMPKDRNQPGAIEEIISSTLMYALVYIYLIFIIVIRVFAGGRNPWCKSWIERSLSAFIISTHWKYKPQV